MFDKTPGQAPIDNAARAVFKFVALGLGRLIYSVIAIPIAFVCGLVAAPIIAVLCFFCLDQD